MADRNDSLFKEFLAAYESGHKLLADINDPNISDEEINAKIAAQSGLVRKFEKWANLPRSVINEYNGHVPDWVLEVAENKNVDELRLLDQNPRMNQEELEAKMREQYAKERDAIFTASAAALAVAAVPFMAAGYNEQTSSALAVERLFRDSMAERAEKNQLTPEERRLWLESRRETFNIIKQDWIKHHPERYLVHLLSKYNRGRISEEELMPRLADLIQKMQTDGRLEHLDEYLNRPIIRAKIRHLKPETLEHLIEAGKQMHGQTEHVAQKPQQQMQQDAHLAQDLPADVVDVLKKMQIIQNNRHQNAEATIDKGSAYQNISPLAREKVRELSRS